MGNRQALLEEEEVENILVRPACKTKDKIGEKRSHGEYSGETRFHKNL